MENKMMVMRRALRDVSRVVEEMTRGTMTGESVDRKTVDTWAKRLCEIISRDLAIPLRNCDVGDAADWEKRFGEECDKGHICSDCPVKRAKTRMAIEHDKGARCEFAWAQMPYEDEKGGAK